MRTWKQENRNNKHTKQRDKNKQQQKNRQKDVKINTSLS